MTKRERAARLGTLQALRTTTGSVDHNILAEALRDTSPDVRPSPSAGSPMSG